ncbi:hypothetical protein [Brevundimonas sp. FT23042]|uniref:hypothetical protein n=1 Tax=Brevundimonas sp. FT23042 TaxID=3393749 RepID=UPI003B5877C7
MIPGWADEEIELLDAEDTDVPRALSRAELLAASDSGWRRCGGVAFDEEGEQ